MTNKEILLDRDEMIDLIDLSDDPQVAENDIESLDLDDKDYYSNKREKLNSLGIVKQSWSVGEIVDKLRSKTFSMEPSYQRSLTWNKERKDSFIESLFMRIIVPPIYLAEIRDKGRTLYEVVDGKQRLSTLQEFINDPKYTLKKKYMDYYDNFDNKSFDEIYRDYQEIADEMLSHTLDCYVITTKTDDEIKYDIFSRINKGAVILTPDEIRLALYNSPLMKYISDKMKSLENDERYKNMFTKQAIKKKKDFGRFFRSIAFSYSITNQNNEIKAVNYNSRPKDFINSVLLKFKKEGDFKSNEIDRIIDLTLDSHEFLKSHSNISKDYYIDAISSIFTNLNANNLKDVLQKAIDSEKFNKTLEISPATTSNVNMRLNLIKSFL
ncbi:conserved hypothetical protein (DUF262) [Alteracholeplasma palmae J233]|uniref:GmrSD restriction endonucleases N-terminal domain-containing protein n=1 Tax=Alteracholeplasma palmae (strain ATCC 49389 / J233) TaxID=1318466 RepID=U4KQ66_ALTPJ|nr:DUF262 domain-containing protein [Alteracholeplasma palmae]CCV64420.1 conserved hypothetical protein (DUF262) [Alteracholeplasma palmae J233]